MNFTGLLGTCGAGNLGDWGRGKKILGELVNILGEM